MSATRPPPPPETTAQWLWSWTDYLCYKTYALVRDLIIYPYVYYRYKIRKDRYSRMPIELRIAWWKFHGLPPDDELDFDYDSPKLREIRNKLAFLDAERTDRLNG